MTSTASTTSVASMTSTVSFNQKTFNLKKNIFFDGLLLSITWKRPIKVKIIQNLLRNKRFWVTFFWFYKIVKLGIDMLWFLWWLLLSFFDDFRYSLLTKMLRWSHFFFNIICITNCTFFFVNNFIIFLVFIIIDISIDFYFFLGIVVFNLLFFVFYLRHFNLVLN